MKYSFIKNAELIPLSPIGMNICYKPVKFEKGDVIDGKRKGSIVMFVKNNKMFAIDDSLGYLFDMQQEIKSNAVGRIGGSGMRGGSFGGMRMGGGVPTARLGGMRGGVPSGTRLGGMRGGRLSRGGRRGYFRNGMFYVPFGVSVYAGLGGMCYYLDEYGYPVYFPCNSWIYDLDVTNIP